MKIFTTVLNVTGITVQPGTTSTAGKAIRDLVVTTTDGDLILRLTAEQRDDLQVTFAGSEQGSMRTTRKVQFTG